MLHQTPVMAKPIPCPFPTASSFMATWGRTRWPTCWHSRRANPQVAWCTPRCWHNDLSPRSDTEQASNTLRLHWPHPLTARGLPEGHASAWVALCPSLGPKWMAFPLHLQSIWLPQDRGRSELHHHTKPLPAGFSAAPEGTSDAAC